MAVPGDRIVIKWREQGVAAVQIDSIEARTARLQASSGLALRSLRNVHDKLDVLRLDHPLSATLMRSAVARLRLDPSIEYAEVDARRYIQAFPVDAPDDPRFIAGADATGQWRGQWYLGDGQAQDVATPAPAAIGATTAWKTTIGSPAIIVAVLDTGVDFAHPDLGRYEDGGPLLPGYDFISCDDGAHSGCGAADALIANDGDGWDANASDPGDWIEAADLADHPDIFDGCEQNESSWHGTRVAGLIAARTNNGAGIAAIAPDVLILPVRVIGKCTGYMSDIIAALRWASGLDVTGVPANPYPATIINLSLGGSQPCSSTEQAAIDEARARGVVIVASAGNDGGPIQTPANCEGVIGVAGLRHVGTKVGYSSVSSSDGAVAIGAPAGNCVNLSTAAECLYSIETTSNAGTKTPEGPTYTYSLFAPGYTGNTTNAANVGTSFAAPMVAGVAALMASVNLNLTPSLLATRMQESATAFPTPTIDENGLAITACTLRSATTDSNGSYTDVPANPTACACTQSTCGAGMVNAAGAVAAALRPIASFLASDTEGSVGQTITLDGTSSMAATGHAITRWEWSASPQVRFARGNEAIAEFVFPALRPITVTLTVTDDAGRRDSISLTIDSSTGIASSGGGGRFGIELWALAALACLVVSRGRRRRPNPN
jgi:serine protease